MVKGPLLDPLRIPSRAKSGAPELAGSIRGTQAASGIVHMKVDHPVGVEVTMVVVHLGAARGGAAQTGAVRRRIQMKERTAGVAKANEIKQE